MDVENGINIDPGWIGNLDFCKTKWFSISCRVSFHNIFNNSTMLLTYKVNHM